MIPLNPLSCVVGFFLSVCGLVFVSWFLIQLLVVFNPAIMVKTTM